MKSEKKINSLKFRFIFFLSLIGAAALVLLIRYGILMLTNEVPPIQEQKQVINERGSILDRNGRILAIELRFADVGIWRPSIEDINLIAKELSGILEMSTDEIRQKIELSSSSFLFLKKHIDELTTRRLSEIIKEKKLKGVMIEPIAGRLYPEKDLACQVIGFVGDRNEGIEYAFDDELSGVGNDGKGSHVVLTLDINVQYILEQIAAKAKEDTGAEAIIFLAMDPRSGDILGSVSLPGFDLNDVRHSNAENRMNMPVIWAYEPGSVFKVFTIASFLNSGAISPNSTFYCNGTYTPLRGEIITCLGNHGRVTPREIITLSCNVGAAYASENISKAAFYNSLVDFGFGSRTGAGSPGESSGLLRDSERWADRSKPTLAFGQEILVSAYQIIQAASAIANNGVLVPPKIVSKIISADGKTITPWEGGASRSILKEDSAKAMRSFMVDAATIMGSGWRAAVGDMSLAVKTGTAQLMDINTKKYSEDDYIASCIAILPSESPSLILYLAIIKPKGEIYGGRIAAPVIREAAESLIDYLGIPRGRNQQVVYPSQIKIYPGRLPEIGTIIPDFTGIAKRTLIPLLLRDDINVEIVGDGHVYKQSPEYGAPITGGMTLVLELE